MKRAVLLTIITASLIAAGLLSASKQKEDSEARTNVLVREHSQLLKTKLAIVEHIRLDPNDPNYNTYKTQIEARIAQTTEEGRQNLESMRAYKDLGDLIIETEAVYNNLEYSVNYLVDLSNLLKKYSRLTEQTQ